MTIKNEDWMSIPGILTLPAKDFVTGILATAEPGTATIECLGVQQWLCDPRKSKDLLDTIGLEIVANVNDERRVALLTIRAHALSLFGRMSEAQTVLDTASSICSEIKDGYCRSLKDSIEKIRIGNLARQGKFLEAALTTYKTADDIWLPQIEVLALSREAALYSLLARICERAAEVEKELARIQFRLAANQEVVSATLADGNEIKVLDVSNNCGTVYADWICGKKSRVHTHHLAQVHARFSRDETGVLKRQFGRKYAILRLATATDEEVENIDRLTQLQEPVKAIVDDEYMFVEDRAEAMLALAELYRRLDQPALADAFCETLLELPNYHGPARVRAEDLSNA